MQGVRIESDGSFASHVGKREEYPFVHDMVDDVYILSSISIETLFQENRYHRNPLACPFNRYILPDDAFLARETGIFTTDMLENMLLVEGNDTCMTDSVYNIDKGAESSVDEEEDFNSEDGEENAWSESDDSSEQGDVCNLIQEDDLLLAS